MKAYLLSLAAGLLIGAICSLMGVPSPAPPIIALIGLAGILAGEQIVSAFKKPAALAASHFHEREP